MIKKTSSILIIFVIIFSFLQLVSSAMAKSDTPPLLIEIHVTGDTNFIVYKVPRQMYDGSANALEKELVSSQKLHVDRSRVEYSASFTTITLFMKDLYEKEGKNLILHVSPKDITSPFHAKQPVQVTLFTNKMIDWRTEEGKNLNEIGFRPVFSLLSERKDEFIGDINSFRNMGILTLKGNINENEVVLKTLIYILLTIISMVVTTWMGTLLRKHVRTNHVIPANVRSVSQKYQIPALLLVALQLGYVIMTGLFLGYEIFLGGIGGVLLAFGPFVISAFFMIVYFIYLQQRIIKEIENGELAKEDNTPVSEIWSMLVPLVVPIVITILVNIVIYFIPVNIAKFDSMVTNIITSYMVQICIITVAYISAPYIYNLLLPKRKLKERELLDRINLLSAKHGIHFNNIYVQSSKNIRIANAMVSGYIHKNLYLYDYLVENLKNQELEAVILHEIAHIKRKHLVKLLGVTCVTLITFQAILYFHPIFGWTSIPLYLIVLLLVSSFYMRRYELEADRFAAFHMGDTNGMISALLTLSRLNYTSTSVKGPIKYFKTHPSIDVRVRHLQQLHGQFPKNRRSSFRH
ncbi:M48 family metalloprotease [Ureibacillus terrenus]|uniref:M48 family metalloprotease n=1 Tax=Ureibacillus terrenus TaxID=118246 RepID=UPI002E1AA4DD|nr:M48 family metalloprotease [Ureibacillus terrenus]